MELKEVNPKGDAPGYWWFIPKNDPAKKIRMIHLGAANVSISEAKALKLFEAHHKTQGKSLWDIIAAAHE